MSRPPLPPFTVETAAQKARMALMVALSKGDGVASARRYFANLML